MAANMEVQLEEFKANVERMLREDEAEFSEVLFSGASAYTTTAARYTPPDMGQANISSVFYTNGVFYDRSSNATARGRRRIYDLLQLARNPDTGHYRKLYGKLLRQGYYYVVSIRRPGKPVRLVPCRTEAEAVTKAHETYRGLTRAAWGMGLSALRGKMPPATRRLLNMRPGIARMARLSGATLDKELREITLTNSILDPTDSFVPIADSRAT